MKIKSTVTAITLMSISTFVFASQKSTQATITAVDQEMSSLQKQMQSLQAEVKTLKSQLKQQQTPHGHTAKQVTVKQSYSSAAKTHAADQSRKFATSSEVMRPKDSPYLAFGNSVVLAPSVGVPAHFDGSSFLINAPSVNTNRYILERTKQELHYYQERFGKLPPMPALILSGDIVGIAQYTNTYKDDSNSDIDLTSADLDAQAAISPWVTGLMEFSYDNSAALESTRRISNSRVFLNQGFLTIGNLEESGYYGTLGQFYAPFGRYSTIMISPPITQYLGRTKARALELGYYGTRQDEPYAEAFIYRGAATTSSDTVINNGGIDVGYHAKLGKVIAHLGVSLVRNIADADGMQDTAAPSGRFDGFNENSDAEKLSHVVPAYDLHGSLSMGNFTFLGEFIDAVRHFSPMDISYNGHGARPAVYTLEGDYSFNMFNRPMTVGLSYGQSFQALGFNVPSQRFTVAWQMAILRYTLLTIEYRHDVNYSGGDTSTHTLEDGSLQSAYDPATLGKGADTITAQLGVYF